MTAVVDSSPRIVLGKVRRLDLLPALYEDIMIPPAVVDADLPRHPGVLRLSARQGRPPDRLVPPADWDAASLYAFRTALIRVCQRGPCARNHPSTSESTRREMDSLAGSGLSPRLTMPRTMWAGSACGWLRSILMSRSRRAAPRGQSVRNGLDLALTVRRLSHARVAELESVLLEVPSSLRLIPRDHRQSVYTQCICVKGGARRSKTLSSRSSRRAEQPLVGDRPHAGRARLDPAAARDDEAGPPCVPRETVDVDGAEDLGERARVGVVGVTRGLDLDRQETVADVKDGVDLAARVGAEEMKGWRRRLPRRVAPRRGRAFRRGVAVDPGSGSGEADYFASHLTLTRCSTALNSRSLVRTVPLTRWAVATQKASA